MLSPRRLRPLSHGLLSSSCRSVSSESHLIDKQDQLRSPSRRRRFSLISTYIPIDMEAVRIPSSSVPDVLKTPCEQILKRASELRKAEPVVAYWCCFAAAQRAIKIPNRTKEATMFLMSLLDALEQMKAILANNEAVTNEAVGSAYIENFALKVFMSADNEDRAGNCGKATIRKFVVAGQFIEVLRCFELPLTEDMEQKLQYARWKAADLAKALREGRTPVPGPPPTEEYLDDSVLPSFPNPDVAASSTPQSATPRGSFSNVPRPTVVLNNGIGGQPSPIRPPAILSPRPSPVQRPRSDLPHLPTVNDTLLTQERDNSFGSGAWSTMATPGLPESEDMTTVDSATARHRSSSAVPSSSEDISNSNKGSPFDVEKKNVRFLGPDGAPLSPAQTMVSVETFDEPTAPPPTAISTSPISPKPPTAPLPRDNPAPSTPPARINGHAAARPSPPVPSSVLPPPPPPPSLASAAPRPPAVAQPHGLGLTSPPVVAIPAAVPVQSSGPPKTLTRREVEQTQKHAKWAISALDYDDYETARAELRKALAMLGG